MERTTEKQLYGLVELLDELMPNKNFHIESGYGMWKLTSKNGSHNESGYMSKKELYNWMQAYKQGFYAAKGQ